MERAEMISPNHALQRTRPSRSGCNPPILRPGLAELWTFDREVSRASNVRGRTFAFRLFQDTVASARFVDSVSGIQIGAPEAAVNLHAFRRPGVSS